MRRKFVFLYLNTGAGHISAARVLYGAIKEADPSCEVIIANGFDRKNYFGHMALEKGYNFAMNYMHGLFPLIYDLGQHRFFQNIVLRIMRGHTTKYLYRLFTEEEVTDVVSFHFALTPFAKRAIAAIGGIRLTTIVTDPFTAPRVWFHENDTRFFVYSKEAKDIALKCGVKSKNVAVVPFLMSEKYSLPLPDKDEVRALKLKKGFDPDKKMVLLVGGGEGLPGAVKIINECILHRAPFAVAIVCGRNKPLMKTLEVLSATYPRFDLHVFGFVDYIDELVKICDVAVIKAGPAMLMEVLSCKKPVIIIKYMYNQELGNMRFAVNNKVGYYIRSPIRAYRKINELLCGTDADVQNKMKSNFERVALDTDASKIAKLLLESTPLLHRSC